MEAIKIILLVTVSLLEGERVAGKHSHVLHPLSDETCFSRWEQPTNYPGSACIALDLKNTSTLRVIDGPKELLFMWAYLLIYTVL